MSVFKDGWYTLDERWNNRSLADQFEVVYSLIEGVRSAIDGNKPLDTMDVMFIADSKDSVIYNILKVLPAFIVTLLACNLRYSSFFMVMQHRCRFVKLLKWIAMACVICFIISCRDCCYEYLIHVISWCYLVY